MQEKSNTKKATNLTWKKRKKQKEQQNRGEKISVHNKKTNGSTEKKAAMVKLLIKPR